MGRAIKRQNKAKRSSNNSESSSASARVWQPGVNEIEEGEELQYDPSAYNSLHAFHVGWPCLSFDVIKDYLGLIRTQFPHTAYFVAGTQANQSSLNSIEICKLSNISGKRRDTNGTDMDKDNEDSDTETDDDEDESGTPKLQLRRVAHQGCVNRIRSMPQEPHICATWSDTGFVQTIGVGLKFSYQLLSEIRTNVTRSATPVFNQAPLAAFKHQDEGYAIDWSPKVAGDCNGSIHLWEHTSGGQWKVDAKPFVGHTSSVEDLQWSPTLEYEFASCSGDGTIALWDIREGKSPVVSIKTHEADVNVISWNRLDTGTRILASGSDNGTIIVHDLRSPKDEDKMSSSVLTKCKYHKYPITSIEWSPNESSTLAVTSSDNQLTIWDFSMEGDEEVEASIRDETEDRVKAPEDIPPGLLFVHQGQKDMKELHWHAQIPGMIISTASDGFNILMPSNI